MRTRHTLFVPNAFSPNGDGNNDDFIGIGFTENIIEYKMEIWNRWGQKLFKTTDMEEAWSGSPYNNGNTVQDGTYVYVITIMDDCGAIRNRSVTKTGWVLLLNGDPNSRIK
jgi:gliding motility-associated-like protein